MKHCIDCQWYTITFGPMCTVPDMVTGRRDFVPCGMARSKAGECGPEATHFSAKVSLDDQVAAGLQEMLTAPDPPAEKSYLIPASVLARLYRDLYAAWRKLESFRPGGGF